LIAGGMTPAINRWSEPNRQAASAPDEDIQFLAGSKKRLPGADKPELPQELR
jgi:hypothetical protein